MPKYRSVSSGIAILSRQVTWPEQMQPCKVSQSTFSALPKSCLLSCSHSRLKSVISDLSPFFSPRHPLSHPPNTPEDHIQILLLPRSPTTAIPDTMDAIKQTFARAKQEKRAALVSYITAGFPTVEETVDILLGLENGGAGA